MNKTSLRICVLFICLFVILGCATHRFTVDMANNVRNHKDLLQMLGKPDCVKRNQDGFEEWIYQSKTYNILKLTYIRRDFTYLLNKNGDIIQKDVRELMCKYRLMPLRELPDEFKQFK